MYLEMLTPLTKNPELYKCARKRIRSLKGDAKNIASILLEYPSFSEPAYPDLLCKTLGFDKAVDIRNLFTVNNDLATAVAALVGDENARFA